ncbi:MAG: hypothetical protein JXR14_05530 [Paracoccaceae bacterium]
MDKVSQNSDDPKGLIREAYRIEGITLGECRSIFLDWALSLPDGVEPRGPIKALLEVYATEHADHPMTVVLSEGLAKAPSAKRRGGRKARVAPN